MRRICKEHFSPENQLVFPLLYKRGCFLRRSGNSHMWLLPKEPPFSWLTSVMHIFSEQVSGVLFWGWRVGAGSKMENLSFFFPKELILED